MSNLEVAKNPNTDAATLTQLAMDKSEDVRYWVAYNRNTDTTTLKKLAMDEHVDVRYEVAHNPNSAHDFRAG